MTQVTAEYPVVSAPTSPSPAKAAPPPDPATAGEPAEVDLDGPDTVEAAAATPDEAQPHVELGLTDAQVDTLLRVNQRFKDFTQTKDARSAQVQAEIDEELAQPLPDTETNVASAHGDRGSVVAEGNHVYPEMAAAGLWTTPQDLLRLGLAVVAAAHAQPNAMLSLELTKEMLTTQAGTHGLGFGLANPGDGLVFSHDGGNRGFISRFYTYADGRGGAAIMINSENGVLVNEVAAALAVVYGWQYGRLR